MEQERKPKKFVYLIQDGNVCKIGQSINPHKRLKAIKTARPSAKLVAYGRNFSEKGFHTKYKDYNIGGEWFQFPSDVYKKVIWEVASKSQQNKIRKDINTRVQKKRTRRKLKREQGKFEDWVLPFGKFKGTKLIDMVSEEQVRYIKYGKNKFEKGSYAQMAFKWWYEYYTGNGKVDYHKRRREFVNR